MLRPIRIFEGRFGRVMLAEVAAPSEPHAHAEPYIFVKHGGGDGDYLIAGHRVALTREDILFLNPGESHQDLRLPGSQPTRLIALQASGDWLRESFPAVFGADDARPFPRPREPITPRIRRLADALAIEAVHDQFLSAERLEFMVLELVLSIVDTYLARRRPGAALWRGSRFSDSRIRRALELLRVRPNKEVNIDELASQVGLSRSRFYDLFQVCTGLSPRAYLNLLCVETAIEKLSSGRAKIAEVSAELGFSAQSNFTRFFLHQVGIPPSEYRRATSAKAGPKSEPPASGTDPKPER
ncbi:MAG: AraC family transcriptional regulator [Betaproteobacteria bacterium]|nr:AraC family transcriptional regulator [Betaproteobacteria bacterium]